MKNKKILLNLARGVTVCAILLILYVVSEITKNYLKTDKNPTIKTTQNKKEKKASPVETELTFYETLTAPSKIEKHDSKNTFKSPTVKGTKKQKKNIKFFTKKKIIII